VENCYFIVDLVSETFKLLLRVILNMGIVELVEYGGVRSNVRVIKIGSEELSEDTIRDFKREIKPYEGSSLVLDLSGVTFVDSSGLAGLITFLRDVHAQNQDLRFTGLTRDVARLFKLVRIDRIFEIYPTVEEAVRSYGPRLEVIGRQ